MCDQPGGSRQPHWREWQRSQCAWRSFGGRPLHCGRATRISRAPLPLHSTSPRVEVSACARAARPLLVARAPSPHSRLASLTRRSRASCHASAPSAHTDSYLLCTRLTTPRWARSPSIAYPYWVYNFTSRMCCVTHEFHETMCATSPSHCNDVHSRRYDITIPEVKPVR